MHFIELPKYEKLLAKQDINIDPMLKKWIEFFIYEGKEGEKMKVLLIDETIKKLTGNIQNLPRMNKYNAYMKRDGKT